MSPAMRRTTRPVCWPEGCRRNGSRRPRSEFDNAVIIENFRNFLFPSLVAEKPNHRDGTRRRPDFAL
jgi:hypothetical protein